MRITAFPIALAIVFTLTQAGDSFAQRGGVRVNIRTGNGGGYRDGWNGGYRDGYRNDGWSGGFNSRGGAYVRYNDGNFGISYSNRPYYGDRYYSYGGRYYSNYYGPRYVLDANQTAPGIAANAGDQQQAPPQQAEPGADSTALLTILVPTPDAELSFDGVAAAERGPEREFRTPAIEKGQTFSYDLTAKWTENGQQMSRSKHVSFKAGDAVLIDLRAEEQSSKTPPPPPTPARPVK